MGSDREQELGRTATAPPSGALPEPAPIGPTLGRYRLEREIGAGAMGVVHAAFDPDLERRIALKVLRGANATTEAKDRLMREARAMARLTHPNVVTVHEVGTASGRDFVAMELIVGENLAEWMRATRRPAIAILEAFIAAGRGLAAAHAAGIVHRDFKPHNVLRNRDGRIVVTDFGLAREVDAAFSPSTGLEATLPLGTVTAVGSSSATSALSGLTVTGALLGTPAYMAPEQWRGGAVTPATDQFAYCVALWEALSGARPYPGPTLDDLRSQVAHGPAALDASRIPRRVRGMLRRGLDPDPARRWPSMEALLDQLVRSQRRAGLAFAAGGVAVAGALAAGLLQLRGGAAPVATCEPPAHDIDTAWSPAIRGEMAAATSDAHVAVLDTAYWSWRAARNAACGAPAPLRQAQLQCLDGVVARFDALRRGYARAPESAAEEIQAQLVDPAVCRRPVVSDIPRLTLAPTPGVIAAYGLYGRSFTEHKPSEAEVAAQIAASAADPCARAVATLAFDEAASDPQRARAMMSDASSAADQCGDERLRADLLTRDIVYQREWPMIGTKGAGAIRRAQIAVNRVAQPDLTARIAMHTSLVALQHGRRDDALRMAGDAVTGFRAHGLPNRAVAAVLFANIPRLIRRMPDDLDELRRSVAAWRPIALAHHKTELVRRLDVQDATARYWLGDLAAAHADLLRLGQAQPPPTRRGPERRITGEVVDARGRPVAGAQVAASGYLYADAIGIGVPQLWVTEDDRDDNLRVTTSDDAGRFTIEDAMPEGAIAAQLGDRRSLPADIADRVKLVLEPTRSVSGKVVLDGVPHTQFVVYCSAAGDRTGRYNQPVPVAPDGSFAISGISTKALLIGASRRSAGAAESHIAFQPLPASPSPTTGLVLSVKHSDRTLDVVVRSAVTTPLEGAQVVLVGGRQQIRNAGDLVRSPALDIHSHIARPAVGENVPRAVIDQVRPGDLVAHVEQVSPGELTVCAIGMTGDPLDPAYMRNVQSHLSQLALKCEYVAADTRRVMIVAPPQQRFDEP